jgi:hypothetical protein
MKFNNFWVWFFKGGEAGPGIRRLFDIWLCFHSAIGGIVAILSPVSIAVAAKGLLLPLAGIFIGLSFAWGGNAQALLQTKEIERMTQFREGGFEEYIYTYQLAILIILSTLVTWGFGGLEIYDNAWPTQKSSILYVLIESFLYFLASLSVRECWHVVLGANSMLLIKYHVSSSQTKKL